MDDELDVLEQLVESLENEAERHRDAWEYVLLVLDRPLGHPPPKKPTNQT